MCIESPEDNWIWRCIRRVCARTVGVGMGLGLPAIIEFIYFESYRQQICSKLAQFVVKAFNHDVSRLDESCGRIALL